MEDSKLPLIVIGGGGHAKVLLSTLLLCRKAVLGFVDLNPASSPLLGVPCCGDDDAVLLHAPDEVLLINGIGSVASTTKRQGVYDRFLRHGYRFATVIHPAAIVAAETNVEAAAQIMAGAVLQPGTTVSVNAIVNSAASVDHDCMLGAHAHIGPRAVLSGGVRVEAGAHIGTGACIIQGICIGAGSIVGAGAVVVEDVPSGVVVVGVPAKFMATTGR